MEAPWGRIFSGLTFKAANAAERSQALECRRRIYELELGHHGTDEFDAAASHLVAVDRSGQVVSAMRIILQRPLEIERYLDLRSVVDGDGAVAQIGGFWVDGDWRQVRQHRFLQVGMLKLALMFGQSRRINQFVMYTYSRLMPLYRAAFFENIGLTFEHPAWGDVGVLRLNLVDLAARSAASRSTVARLLSTPHLTNFVVTDPP